MRQLGVTLAVQDLELSVGADGCQLSSQRNKQLQLPRWLHTLQETAVFSEDIEEMQFAKWFGLAGLKNILYIN